MPVEIDLDNTERSAAFKLWIKAPNPMVTIVKTLDVTSIIRVSRKRSMKFNMLMGTSKNLTPSICTVSSAVILHKKILTYVGMSLACRLGRCCCLAAASATGRLHPAILKCRLPTKSTAHLNDGRFLEMPLILLR